MAQDATLKDIRDYFGLTVSEMTQAWKAMTDKDKTDLKSGIGNGSLDY